MGEQTGISWCHHTFNAWWGCTEVSPACDDCYAKTWARRYGHGWGPDARRRFFDTPAHWNDPVRWNRKAEENGVRRRVFCMSMGDLFERLPASHPDAERMDRDRERVWALIEATPSLDWLLLTKRPQEMTRMAPARWAAGWPANVWAGTTVEAPEFLPKRVPFLLQVPARVRFLSCEPLLGPLDLGPWFRQPWLCEFCYATHYGNILPPDWDRVLQSNVCGPCAVRVAQDGGYFKVPAGAYATTPDPRPWKSPIHWVIGGGESGRKARPSNPDWFRGLRDQSVAAGVAFHFKQWGDLKPTLRGMDTRSGFSFFHGIEFERVGKKEAGRELDGRTWDQLPEPARA